MKRNLLTMISGGVLLVVFGLTLFMFQVRKTEVAVVTTFGKPSAEGRTEPGAYFRWPWPIQKVHKLDQRIQNFEDRFEQISTADGFPLLVNVYVGWRIAEPNVFFPKFASDSGEAAQAVEEAEKSLEGIVRDKKNAVVGQHNFADFVSTDEKQIQFPAIEAEILAKVQESLKARKYGVEIAFLGIKKLGLPESVTQNVFGRMKSERQKQVSKIESDGKAEAEVVRSAAERDASKIIAEADAQATRIRGEGEAKAAESFAVFQQNPELANLLLKLSALETTLQEKTTLILDQNTPPLDLLQQGQPKK